MFPVRFFLKGAEQQFGRVQRRALVRNGSRGRSLVSRSLIHIDPETDRSAFRRLAAPGKPAAEAEAEKGEGEGEDVHDRWPPLWHKRLRV
ncbi:hypothetical protein Amuc02_22060 [Akkermansia muciniphila]|nr:hypothetical protein Amuc02_22060 [Akkermansia muciniphila]